MEQVHNPPKKMKRMPILKDEWQILFGICEIEGNKLVCLFCGAVFTFCKQANLKRHYLHAHSDFEERFPLKTAYEARCAEIANLKFQRFNAPFIGNRSILVRKPSFHVDLKTATKISLAVTHYLTKNDRPFDEAESYREVALEILKYMFKETDNEQLYIDFVKQIPLSQKTMLRHSKELVDNVVQQLYNDLNNCKFFSIQLDRSTNVVGTIQVILFVRIVFDDLNIKEEFLSLISLRRKRLDQDIYSQFENELEKKSLPFHKLISITRNGSENITEGLIQLLKRQTSLNNIHEFSCIMNQQASCIKTLSIPEVEFVVTDTINLIRPHLVLFRQSKGFSAPEKAEFRVLKYYCTKSLNREEMMEHFYENITIIDKFSSSTGLSVPELQMFSFITKLAFIVDMTNIFKEFNLQMQVKNKFIWEYVNNLDHIKTFLFSAASCFKLCKIHSRFVRLNRIANENYGDDLINLLTLFASYIENLISAFYDKFKDLEIIRILYNYFSTLFDVSLDPVEKEEKKMFIQNCIVQFDPEIEIHGLETDLDNLPMDHRLRGVFLAGGNIWPIVALENKYPRLLSVYQKLTCFFGSTYLCDLAFVHLKNIKCAKRKPLTDNNLNNLLRLSTGSYSPNIEKLSIRTDYHLFH